MTSTAHAYARHCAQVQGVGDERAESHQAEVERTADCDAWPDECPECVYHSECLTRAAHHQALAKAVREQIAEDRSLVGVRAVQDYLTDSWPRREADEGSSGWHVLGLFVGIAAMIVIIRLVAGE